MSETLDKFVPGQDGPMLNMEAGLAYFMRLQEYTRPGTPDHSKDMWDKRADVWEKEYNQPDVPDVKSGDRVEKTVEYLRGKGLLGSGCDVVDVGCGPGRFVAAFARTARQVTGIDLSGKMVEYGAAYAKREGLSNVSFLARDFQTLDIEAEGLAGRFDLVFSSITPAIHGMNGLEKLMRLSRAYCYNSTLVHGENALERAILHEVFGRECPAQWDGHWFYSLFNVLFLMGYYPDATFYKREKTEWRRPEQAYAQAFASRMLPREERTEEAAGRVLDWMEAHAGPDGLVEEKSCTWYGWTLWDVRERTTRPMQRHEREDV